MPGEHHLPGFISEAWWRGYNGVGLHFRVWAWQITPGKGNLDASAYQDFGQRYASSFVDTVFQHDASPVTKQAVWMSSIWKNLPGPHSSLTCHPHPSPLGWSGRLWPRPFRPKSVPDLLNAQNEWPQIPSEIFLNLVEILLKRVEERNQLQIKFYEFECNAESLLV